MRKATVVLACVLASPAFGQGLGSAPANWSGFYVGANGGGGSGNPTGTLGDADVPFPIIGDSVPSRAVAVFPPGAEEVLPANLGLGRRGAFRGLQAGFNWQSGRFIYGFETDFQVAALSSMTLIELPSQNFWPTTTTAHSRLDWFGTFRGKLGVTASERLLLYVTGGLAYGRVDDRAQFVVNDGSLAPPTFIAQRQETLTGPIVGAGGELALTPAVSVKAEYLYMNLGGQTLRLLDPNLPANFVDYRFHHQDHLVRVGLNFKFGSVLTSAR